MPPVARILVIDDSEVVLEAAAAALEEAGYEVLTSTAPRAPDGAIDFVLLDVQMPDVFGDDVARYFRDELGVTAPIYLFSSVPEEELRERAEAAGATGYLCKGWGLERVVETIRALLPSA